MFWFLCDLSVHRRLNLSKTMEIYKMWYKVENLRLLRKFFELIERLRSLSEILKWNKKNSHNFVDSLVVRRASREFSIAALNFETFYFVFLELNSRAKRTVRSYCEIKSSALQFDESFWSDLNSRLSTHKWWSSTIEQYARELLSLFIQAEERKQKSHYSHLNWTSRVFSLS